jgi:pullulanase/glycogen debranching enzyme
MENEKFQDLVLEHLAKLTQDIIELKTGQKELETGQKELKTGQIELRKDVEELKGGQHRLEAKLDLVYNHTVKLNEDLTVTNQKMDVIQEDLNYRRR